MDMVVGATTVDKLLRPGESELVGPVSLTVSLLQLNRKLWVKKGPHSDELQQMLKQVGFEIEAIQGDYTDPWT